MKRKCEMKNSLQIIVEQFEASGEYTRTTMDQRATLSVTDKQARPR